MLDKARDIITLILALFGIIAATMCGFLLILICQPFFWLAIISITLIIYLL